MTDDPKPSPLARTDTWRALAPFLSITALGLFGTGLLVKPPTPSTARPPESLPSLEMTASDRIDLRLWQDPFAAVEEDWKLHQIDVAKGRAQTRAQGAKEEVEDKAGGADLHSIEFLVKHVKSLLENPSSRLLVLPVALPSTWYQRDREERRRSRFALCAALESRSFVPVDAAFIRYCALPPDSKGTTPDSNGTTILLPFETFRSDGTSAPKTKRSSEQQGVARASTAALPDRTVEDTAPTDYVVVVWVRDKDLAADEKMCLEKLYTDLHASAESNDARLADEAVKRLNFVILGPRSSDTLARLIGGSAMKGSSRLRWVSATATVPQPDAEAVIKKNLHLVRTTPTDDKVMHALVEELVRRRVDVKSDPIVVLCEYDSTYTRTLHDLLRSELEDRAPGVEVPLTRYSYLRGLEGEKRQDTQSGASAIEETQVDYVMALAREIREHFDAKGESPRAIGLFGIDIFDKLLLLRVLRPVFPQALFFTFDLDTRLLDPDELPTTRNLLVASGFGFSVPASDDQGTPRLPPMRGSSQTSIASTAELIVDSFVTSNALARSPHPATTSAAKPGSDDQLQEGMKKGVLELQRGSKIFEIGSRSAVDLATSSFDGGVAGRLLAILLAVPLLFVLLAQTGTWSAALIDGTATRAHRRSAGRWAPLWTLSRRYVLPFFALNVLVLGVAAIDGLRPGGEPFYVWNGVSTWPSVLLYAWSSYIAVLFLHRARARLARTRRVVAHLSRGHPPFARTNRTAIRKPAIAAGNGVSTGTSRLTTAGAWLIRSAAHLPRLAHRLATKAGRLLKYAGMSLQAASPTQPRTTTNSILRSFIQETRLEAVWCRVLGLVVIQIVLASLLFAVWGFPSKPTRGLLNHVCLIAGIFAAVLTLQVLLFFILTATRKALVTCRALQLHIESWQQGIEETPTPPRRISELRNAISAAGSFSNELESMVSGPFASLAIMVIARSAGFDRFDWPLSLILTLALSATLVLVNGHFFGRALGQMQKAASRYLEQWLQHHPEPATNTATNAEAIARRDHRMLQSVAANQQRSGPFAWVSWSTIEALLLSFGGVWALRFLETLSSRT